MYKLSAKAMVSDTPGKNDLPPASSSPSSIAENTQLALLGNTLTSCLDMLKIEEASIRMKAVEFVGSLSPETINAYGKSITALKAIADACTVNGKLFSQSDMCDFLTVAAKEIVDPSRANTKAVNDATFQIYGDIMENYPNAENSLKLHYPRVIIDTICSLDKGVDTRGEAVGIYSIDRYYQERKAKVVHEDPEARYFSRQVHGRHNKTSLSATTSSSYSDEIVENLMHMTSRSRKELERSLAGLPSMDIKKITDLSLNYKRLQKYNKLLSTPDAFKKEVEKELGRKLTDNQLQHAINSIRKSKSYIENILDGKFLPHGTHGINHVKHNLEYGYQLMGLMEPRKRRSI